MKDTNINTQDQTNEKTSIRRQVEEHAVIVHDYYQRGENAHPVTELKGLAQSAGAIVDGYVRLGQKRLNRKTYITSGKINEIREIVQLLSSTLVIFESALSPIQERDLERELRCRVIDRVRLILDIFALRARTREGKLQVELAQLQHMSTRLVRGWTHLERQRGGIGLRGPGETQLETDRRLIGVRIKRLTKQLDRVISQRALHRRRRERKPIPVVSIVGYTNAGKSSLFNRLTGSDVYVADQLFATLDPTIRRIEVPGFGPLLLSDTVGFIRSLPTSLVEAFRATLEEVVSSQLLVHVVDFSEPDYRERMREVELVLVEIGASEIPRLTVFNKIDLTEIQAGEVGPSAKVPKKLWLSAQSGAGIAVFRSVLRSYMGNARKTRKLRLSEGSGKFRSKLYELAQVQAERIDEEGNWLVEVLIDPETEGRLNALSDSGAQFAWIE